MQKTQQITPHQFSFFRIIFGLFLLLQLCLMLFYTADILTYFQEGKERYLFPNIFLFFENPQLIFVEIIFAILLCLSFILGYKRQLSSLLLWYMWSCLSIKGNLWNVPGLSWSSWLLIIIATLPKGEPWALDKQKENWQFPSVIYGGSWIILGVGYLLSLMNFQYSWQWLTGLIFFHLFVFNSRWLKPSNKDSKPILFFDGVCGLCNHFVDFLFIEDSQNIFMVATLQGKTAKKHLSPEDYENLESVIVVDDGTKYKKSEAVLKTLFLIGGFWRLLVILKVFPQSFRDAIYGMIVKNRYRLFGKKESCRLPTSEERQRFLE